MRDLTGLIDPHNHTAPDTRPRSLDDVAAARQAAGAGMRAIVLKLHVTLTADRAAIAERVVGGGVRVLGGLALNRTVGGLNSAAVDAARGFIDGELRRLAGDNAACLLGLEDVARDVRRTKPG